MAWRSDIVGVLRGLESVSRALVEHQGREWQQIWSNSSIRTTLQQSQNVAPNPEQLQEMVQKRMQNFSSQAANVADLIKVQASAVVETIRYRNQSSSDPEDFSEVKTSGTADMFSEDSTILSAVNRDSNNTDRETESTTSSRLNKNMSESSFHTAASSAANPVTAAAAEVDSHASSFGFEIDSPVGTSEPTGKVINDAKREPLSPASCGPSPFGNMSIEAERLSNTAATATAESVAAATVFEIGSSTTGSKIETPGESLSPPSQAGSSDGKQTLSSSASSTKKKIPHPPAPKLSARARERRVPANRVSRLMSYGSLAAGLGAGAVAEITRRSLGLTQDNKLTGGLVEASPFLTEANLERIVNTLCRVRGAALKLGQMLSIQDNSFINPQLQAIFERVRQSADFMPTRQMMKVMSKELGSDWMNKFESFEEKPFAAASIGQVHKGVLKDGREVAVKIQYPGVAQSIESDINNLMSVLNVWNILPPGMYVDSVIKVAKRELAWEVDYIRESDCSTRFRELLHGDKYLIVPEVIPDLSTCRILTTDFVEGMPLDQCVDLDQETRNKIGTAVLGLCLKELFEWRFMQTDPNWSNFLYNPVDDKLVLLDFGASREFPKTFVDTYIKVIQAAAVKDKEGVLHGSKELGFLTGYETKVMEDTHCDAVMILGESFGHPGLFDFGAQNTTHRIQSLIPVMLKHRLTPPPEETYSLHRKMSGAFLLCVKLGSKVDCKSMFDEVWENYKFGAVETEL